MASSGIVNGYYRWTGLDRLVTANANNAELTLIFDWRQTGKSVRLNASEITWTLKAKLGSLDNYRALMAAVGNHNEIHGITLGNSGLGKDFELKINGETVYTLDEVEVAVLENETIVIDTGMTTVYHDGDGFNTSSFSYITYWDNILPYNAVTQQGDEKLTFNGTFNPDPVTRNAVIETFPINFNDEQNPTITYYNPAADYAIQLKAGISITHGQTMEVAYRDLPKVENGTYSFTLSAAELSTLYAAVLDKGKIETAARFYLVSEVPTVDGLSTTTVTVYKDTTINFINYTPTLDVTLYDTDTRAIELTGNRNIFIRNVSDIYFDLGAQAHKDAHITAHFIQNGDDINNTDLTGTLTNITDNRFYVSLTDNRNYGDYEIIDISIEQGRFIDYFPVTCLARASYLDANGHIDVTVTGKYFQGNFGVVANTLTVQYWIRDPDDTNENWVSLGHVNPTMDYEDNYTYEFDINGLDYTGRYELSVRVIDEASLDYSVSSTVVAALPRFDWGPNDFAFHVPVTMDGSLDVAGALSAEGSPVLDFVIEQGTSGIWDYRLWKSGRAECWGTSNISVAYINTAWGALYTSGSITGPTFPFTFAAAPRVMRSFDAGAAGGILMTPGSGTATTTSRAGSFEIARGTATDSAVYKINYYVVGRYK